MGNGIGYFGWSWKGNGRSSLGSDACYLDYLDLSREWSVYDSGRFNPTKLTHWGCELVRKLQSQPASIFGSSDSWSKYPDLICSPEGNFLSCDRFGGGHGEEFSCGEDLICRKSTQDTSKTDWAFWCVANR